MTTMPVKIIFELESMKNIEARNQSLLQIGVERQQ